MKTYILIDYRSAKVGKLNAIQYPIPFSLVIFMSDTNIFSASEVSWMNNANIDVTIHNFAMRDVDAIPLMMSEYVGELSQRNDAKEILVVSSNPSLDIVFNKITNSIKPRLVKYIAALPTVPSGKIEMTKRVREARMTVMASTVCILFAAFLVAFVFLIEAYGSISNASADAVKSGLPTEKMLLFDFGSYVLPGIAAVSAGIGLFTKRWEGFFYFFSAFLVMLGFISYMCSKKEFLDMVPGDPYFLAASTFWIVYSFAGFISCAALFALSVVTHKWHAGRGQNWLRSVYFLLGAAMLIALVPLIGMTIQMRYDPVNWATKGSFHEEYKKLSQHLL